MACKDSKIRALMKFIPLLTTVAAFVLLSGGHHAFAEKADRSKPLQVEADRMQHDESKQLTLLTGSVQAVKGTLVMRAAPPWAPKRRPWVQAPHAPASGRRQQSPAACRPH